MQLSIIHWGLFLILCELRVETFGIQHVTRLKNPLIWSAADLSFVTSTFCDIVFLTSCAAYLRSSSFNSFLRRINHCNGRIHRDLFVWCHSENLSYLRCCIFEVLEFHLLSCDGSNHCNDRILSYLCLVSFRESLSLEVLQIWGPRVSTPLATDPIIATVESSWSLCLVSFRESLLLGVPQFWVPRVSTPFWQWSGEQQCQLDPWCHQHCLHIIPELLQLLRVERSDRTPRELAMPWSRTNKNLDTPLQLRDLNWTLRSKPEPIFLCCFRTDFDKFIVSLFNCRQFSFVWHRLFFRFFCFVSLDCFSTEWAFHRLRFHSSRVRYFEIPSWHACQRWYSDSGSSRRTYLGCPSRWGLKLLIPPVFCMWCCLNFVLFVVEENYLKNSISQEKNSSRVTHKTKRKERARFDFLRDIFLSLLLDFSQLLGCKFI